MSTRTVRLDEESERLLAEIQQLTGTTVSGALKHGLKAAHRELREKSPKTAWEVFRTLELGPGGYARGSARTVKRDMLKLLRRKHRR